MTDAVSRQRTRGYLTQIKSSFLFKGLAVAASFFVIPLMIRYLGQEQFGVWSTILSVMSWVVFFDLGIGNGLRNQIAAALAKNDSAGAVRYISASYSLIGVVALVLFIAVSCAAFFVPWQSVFNTRNVPEVDLRTTVLVSAFFIFLNFWLSLVGQLLNAVQKTSAIVFGQFLTNAFALAMVAVLAWFTAPSLILLASAFGIALVGANLVLSLWFYRRRPDLAPHLSLDFAHVRPMLSFGLQFFVIQLAGLVIFTTDKILITQLFGPASVTQYDVVFKLFGIITLLHSLIMAPLWSSYTDAYHRNDLGWMRAMVKKQIGIFLLCALAAVALAVLARPLIRVWIGPATYVSPILVVSMTVFVMISAWSNIFAYLVNGIGAIKLQLISASIAMLINIPLSIFFTRHLGLGVEGVVWATCVSLSLFAVLGPLQVRALLKGGTPS